MNKNIYVTFDGLREEIIDSFIRNNDKAAIVDIKTAFAKQADDNSHIILYKVVIANEKIPANVDVLFGIPVIKLYDSEDSEDSE